MHPGCPTRKALGAWPLAGAGGGRPLPGGGLRGESKRRSLAPVRGCTRGPSAASGWPGVLGGGDGGDPGWCGQVPATRIGG